MCKRLGAREGTRLPTSKMSGGMSNNVEKHRLFREVTKSRKNVKGKAGGRNEGCNSGGRKGFMF